MRADDIARILDTGAIGLGRGGRQKAQGSKWRGGEAYVSESDERVVLKVVHGNNCKLRICSIRGVYMAFGESSLSTKLTDTA